MSSGSTGSTFPRWQLALLLGAPVALGLGYLYYRQSSSVDNPSNADEQQKKKKATLNDKNKSISIDDKCGGDAKEDQTAANGGVRKELTPLEQAIEYKNMGNERFRTANYAEAIEFYDKAIHNCPSTCILELSTFYQNRAAAYENLKNWAAVSSYDFVSFPLHI